MPATRYPLLAAARRYFYSGWAFLIPYLAVYLLYYITGWPVNPSQATAEGTASSALTPLTPYSPYRFIPSLLHLYWALHTVHLALAGAALWSWVQDRRAAARLRTASPYSLPATRYSLLTALAPWAILALIFYIPGVYLEWPSDPWEHLRRINEWRIHDTVGAHSSWHKSSYFIPYSLLSWCTGLRQLFWLDFYYTGICLLLCRQYFRFARACGLGERSSMVFVIIQALLFGNNIFSFYRYYGISSSIYAQLGAIALTRIVLEWAARGTNLASAPQETTTIGNDAGTPLAPRSPTAPHPFAPSPVNYSFYSLLATRYSLLSLSSRLSFWHLPSLLRLLATGLCLLVLIAFNHIQGLGIAAFGILAVIVWRLIEWKRSIIGWFALTAILLSLATVRWFPHHLALDEANRTQGWLTAWYGFNLFSPVSPAFERSLQILGALGILNLGAGLWLLGRNHLVGWLAVMPVLALVVPCFALPMAHVLATHNSVITFQRFLYAIPTGLALLTVLTHGRNTKPVEAGRSSVRSADPSARYRAFPQLMPKIWSNLPALLLPAPLLLLLILPPGRVGFNRFWQSTKITPKDLQLKPYIAAWVPPNLTLARDDSTLLVTSPLGTRVQEGFSPGSHRDSLRLLAPSIVDNELEQQLIHLGGAPQVSHSSPFAKQIHSGRLPDWMIIPFSFRKPTEDGPAINLVGKNPAWLGGDKPELRFSGDTAVINNPTSAASHVFNSFLIPIDHDKRYRLSSILQQSGSPAAINYLAVAWYDREGNLLESNQALPRGAGVPAGWANGTYSYYCLVGLPAPASWARYTISFGQGEMAAIPANAAFMRAGALLNYKATPNAKIELKQVVLREKAGYVHALFVLPRLQNLYSPYSIAAQLSSHWLPQKASQDYVGSVELRAALRTHSN